MSSDARDEIRAAGRAIQMLIEEIDLLNVDLWNLRARGHSDPAQPEPPADATTGGDDLAAEEESPERTLRWRLAGFRQPRSPAD